MIKYFSTGFLGCCRAFT